MYKQFSLWFPDGLNYMMFCFC